MNLISRTEQVSQIFCLNFLYSSPISSYGKSRIFQFLALFANNKIVNYSISIFLYLRPIFFYGKRSIFQFPPYSLIRTNNEIGNYSISIQHAETSFSFPAVSTSRVETFPYVFPPTFPLYK